MARQPNPSAGKSATIAVRLQPASLDRIDRWRLKQTDAPSRPEAIRRLVSEAFKGLD